MLEFFLKSTRTSNIFPLITVKNFACAFLVCKCNPLKTFFLELDTQSNINFLLGKMTDNLDKDYNLDKELEELENPDKQEEELDDPNRASTNIDEETLAKLTIEKIEKQNNQKEWVVSSSKKYVLKEGKFGHYVEEWNSKTNTKTNNYRLKQ